MAEVPIDDDTTMPLNSNGILERVWSKLHPRGGPIILPFKISHSSFPLHLPPPNRSRMETKTIYTIIGIAVIVTFITFAALYKFGSVFGNTPSYKAHETELHYAIVMDAGSSGTRAYLYSWPSHSGDKHELLQISPVLNAGEPLFKSAKPGLSSLAESPGKALKYIKPLLDFASQNIPAEKHKSTPLYILATAGMRLLEKSQQEQILTKLREGIAENFDFYFPEGNLEIISGKQEGIYQWLAINYVLGKFHHREHVNQGEELVAVEPSKREGENLVFRPRTVGALDMGGASMQIATEITSNLQLEGMSEKDKGQVAEINLGCTEHDTEHTYRVFVTTFLGFGANQALERHNRYLLLGAITSESGIQGLDGDHRIKDPCLPIGMKNNITVDLNLEALTIDQAVKEKLHDKQTVFLYGTGDWEACYAQLQDFTRTPDKFINCQENCPDQAMRAPPIEFDNSEFYGFSEFWYTMEDVLNMGGKYIFDKYQAASKDFCSTKWHLSWTKFLQGQYPKSDAERLKTQCFKSTWLTVALHEGLTFPRSYSHLSAAPNTVHGEVVHWTIGALLYRTRFFPLRDINPGASIHHGKYHNSWESGYLYSHYIVALCLLAVCVCIALYLCRLRRYVKPSTLRKVPSMSFWIAPDEEEALVKQEQADYLYAHTKVYVG